MPCMDSRGELSEVARKLLTTMKERIPLAEVAQQTGLPVYRVRSAARELVEAGLAEDDNGFFVVTESGRGALARSSGTHP